MLAFADATPQDANVDDGALWLLVCELVYFVSANVRISGFQPIFQGFTVFSAS